MHYTWEAMAWSSFLSSDCDYAPLSKKAHYTKQVIIQLYKLMWWPSIHGTVLKAKAKATLKQWGASEMVIACGKDLHSFNFQFKELFSRRSFNSVCNVNLKATLQLCTGAKEFWICHIIQVEIKHFIYIYCLWSNSLLIWINTINIAGLILYMFLPAILKTLFTCLF